MLQVSNSLFADDIAKCNKARQLPIQQRSTITVEAITEATIQVLLSQVIG
jgi:hypothetical protein